METLSRLPVFDELNNLFNDYKDFAEIYESLNPNDKNELVANLQQLNNTGR